MVGTQFNVNEVLVFFVWGVYPHGMVLESRISCFEIPKHTRKTCDYFVCFELGFL